MTLRGLVHQAYPSPEWAVFFEVSNATGSGASRRADAVALGVALARALSLAHRSQKELWVALGHSEGAQVNRWIRGTERLQFDALMAVDWLRRPLLLALAELDGGVVIRTHITLEEWR